jgi:hypothetical protein
MGAVDGGELFGMLIWREFPFHVLIAVTHRQ